MTRLRFSNSYDDQQVDPFNAGEPIMPWDEPGALVDDIHNLPENDSHTLDEKPHDSYRAPRRPNAPHETRVANPKTAETESASQNPGCLRTVRKAAVAIVAAVVLLDIIGSCTAGLFDNTVDSSLSDQDAYLQDDSDDQAIASMATARMDNLSQDPDALKLAAQGLDNKLKSYLGYSAEELGIDADAYAEWFFSKLSYQVNYAYDYDDGTGIVAFDITSPIVYQLTGDLYDKSSDYLMENELYGSFDGTDASPLTEEQQDRMRGFFAEVLTDAELEDSGILSFAVSKDADGTWHIDEDEFQENLDYLFGVI